MACAADVGSVRPDGPRDGGSIEVSAPATDGPAATDAGLGTDGGPATDAAGAGDAAGGGDAAGAGDAAAGGDAALPLPTPSFLVGYNEGWFGANYGTDLTTNFDLDFVAQTFDGILAAGGHLVRLWLFEYREGFVLGTYAPQTQGLDPALLVNLGQVLTAARVRGLWVYLTALEGNEMQKIPELRDYYWNLLNNVYGEGDAYNNNVLAPVLTLLDEHREVLYGFDLMNEIQAPRSVGLWADPIGGPRAWMQRTTAFIKARTPWLRVTSTAGWDNCQYDIIAGFYSGLGLDFYDLHQYSDDGAYAGATAVCNQAAADGVPVILGEFGQKTQVIDDLLQYNVTGAFLWNARGLCFTAALAWRYDYGPSCWDFLRQDGSYRPAVSVMQTYGALP
jgi:hypothetical protein